ncbi:unnamed protein product [Merluccius merluccius]
MSPPPPGSLPGETQPTPAEQRQAGVPFGQGPRPEPADPDPLDPDIEPAALQTSLWTSTAPRDEIYELSYTKEPRKPQDTGQSTPVSPHLTPHHNLTPPGTTSPLHLNPKIQPVASVKPPVVAEWGSGVTPRLDPDTISKHVKQMVDSIMKNYDQNLDGFISLEDFEKISANFPFSFCTHETDRQGQISREEISSYFMRGMSVCAKLGFNFNDVHNFQEATYKRSTACNGCGGALSGVKQGYQCRDCGMNCHKHCRALVGMECLRKHKMAPSSCLCTPDARTKGNICNSEEDAFVFPPTGDTDPARKSSDPARKSSDPTRKGSDPMMKRSDSMRKSSDPMMKRSDSMRKSSDPMMKRSDSMRKSSDPMMKSSDPTRKSSDPMMKSSDPTRKSSDPMMKSSDPTRKSSDPMMKSSDPTRKTSDLTRKGSDPMMKSSDPTRKTSDLTRKGSDPMMKPSDPMMKSGGLAALSHRSTQTDPGVWTPERKHKRGERSRGAEPPRARGCSVPVSFLQEKMEELHLSKERSREPD